MNFGDLSPLRRAGVLALAVCAGLIGSRDSMAQAPGPSGFDFYVLALSWSPSFCALEGREKGRRQCEGPPQGFVLHGLWPQNERGYPEFCEHPSRNAPASVIRSISGLFPEDGLARHQWRKHGTCAGLPPTAYFADVKRAVARVTIPPTQGLKRNERVRPRDVERAFIDANPGLRPGMLAATCVRGMLQEVRVCLTRDLRGFTPCPEVVRRSCRAQEVAAPTR